MAKPDDIYTQFDDAWAVVISQPDGGIRLACGGQTAVATFMHRHAAEEFCAKLQEEFDRYDKEHGRETRSLSVVPIEVRVSVFRSKAARRRAQTRAWGKPIRP